MTRRRRPAADPWSAGFGRLLHAYGWATDTPAHLAALADGDEEARRAARGHLWSAIIHQGTPWTATPPAALAVAELLGDARLAGPDHADLRADLLNFLAAVARAGRANVPPFPDGVDIDAALAAVEDEDAIYGDEILGNAVYGRAIAGCRDVTPTIAAAAVTALSDEAPTVRAAAANVIGAAAHAPNLSPTEHRDAGPDERAAFVLAMGELGLDPSSYLRDPHPGVRACAALAPALATDPAATEEILAALLDPAATDDWFTNRPPQIRMRIRGTLIAAAVDRVSVPDRLLPAALALAPIATGHTAAHDWGVLLRAFEPGSPAQLRYVGALVANDDLWDPGNGTIGLIFRDAGLPYDRAACRALAQTTPGGPTR